LIGGGEGSTKTVKDLPKLAQTTYLEKDGKKKINSLHFKTRAGGAWARVIIASFVQKIRLFTTSPPARKVYKIKIFEPHILIQNVNILHICSPII